MACKYHLVLNAFHDGELDEAAAHELGRHLETCPACMAELAEIREVSSAFGALALQEMSPAGMARAHNAAEAAAGEFAPPVLRVAGLLTGLAASILVVASAWLRELSVTDARPLLQVTVMPAPAPEWERIAMTLDAGPATGATPETPSRVMLADSDARLAEWMLQNLGR